MEVKINALERAGIVRIVTECFGQLQRQNLQLGAAGFTTFAVRAAVLNWRTRHRTIRAKNATITRERLQSRAAAITVIKKLAGIGEHRFCRLFSAIRASDRRL